MLLDEINTCWCRLHVWDIHKDTVYMIWYMFSSSQSQAYLPQQVANSLNVSQSLSLQRGKKRSHFNSFLNWTVSLCSCSFLQDHIEHSTNMCPCNVVFETTNRGKPVVTHVQWARNVMQHRVVFYHTLSLCHAVMGQRCKYIHRFPTLRWKHGLNKHIYNLTNKQAKMQISLENKWIIWFSSL